MVLLFLLADVPSEDGSVERRFRFRYSRSSYNA